MRIAELTEIAIYREGFDNVYVTELGNIVSCRGPKAIVLSPYSDRKGYRYVKIWNSATRGYAHVAIHRAVAQAFIPNPDNKPEVNHKDRVKSNNHISNLEWSTRVDNVAHADNPIRNNLVCELWYNGVMVREFDSKAQACRYASDTYGAGKVSLMKYGKSQGCVVVVKV